MTRVPRRFPRLPRFDLRCGVLLALISLLLAGCASLDATDPATDRAEDETASAIAAGTWWRDFQDPLLAELIQQAMQANPNIAAAQAALQQARALRDVRLATTRPQVTVSGSVQRNKTENTPARVGYNTGLDASWELDLFGANRSTVASSEADLSAARASLRDVQLSMSAEVALAYIQLRGLQLQLTLAQDNLASQLETLRLTQWRAQAGLVTALEVAQAQAAASQTAAQIPSLQNNLAVNRHSLAVLTGKKPGELDDTLARSGPIPWVADTVAQVIPADSLRQRPDLRAAEARITAALASVDAAQAARKPNFRLGGSLGLTALTLAGLGNAATLATQVLGSVSIPVIDGGSRAAQVRVQQAALAQSRANYQNTMLTALKEVEDALVTLRNDRLRLDHLKQAESAARQADALAQDRFSSGLIDFQTVLQTQRTVLSAQDSLANLQAQLAIDHVRLVKAMGGGWQ